VPYPPGGPLDQIARVLAEKLREPLGQPVVVENRAGAGGNIGADLVAKAAPDGHAIVMGAVATHAINPWLYKRMPYDPAKDFTPVIRVAQVPNVLVMNAETADRLAIRTLADLVAYAKKNPGKLNYASSGNGTIVQLTAELFKAQAGVFVTHIPYKGTGLAIPDLVAGQLDVLFDSLPTGMPHVRDGRLRALAVTTLKRTPLAPDLPPVADTLPGFESSTWFGLYGPKGLPAEVVNRVNTAANQALSDPEVRAKLTTLGIEPVTSTPAQFAKMVADDQAKWKRIIAERKIVNE